MFRFSISKFLLTLLLTLSVFACSELGFETKKDALESTPVPDCKKNYTKEVTLLTGPVHKTRVRYESLDARKAFDTAMSSLQKMGYRLTSGDRDSGMIDGEMTLGGPRPVTYSTQVKIEKEGPSVTVYLSSKASAGTMDPSSCCTFYAEFEKLLVASPIQPKPERPLPSPQKPQQTGTPTAPLIVSPPKAVSSTAPTAEPAPAPAATPPAPPAPKVTQVIWSNVNLREGPGMNYKVIGNVKKGTSLSILEENGGWLRVRLEEGKEVWVAKSATSESVPKSAAAEGGKKSSSQSPARKANPSKIKSPM